MIIIGITGMLGAGKGTIVEFLKTKGFVHYSAREFISNEVRRRGLELTRDNMTDTADDLRKNHFPGYIISELLKEAQAKGQNAVIESVRSLGEIDVLRNEAKNAKLFAVDADIRLRYERAKARKSSTDFVSFEKFVADEEREANGTEIWTGNLRACIKQADVIFENNGTIEELNAKIDAELSKMGV